MSLLWIPCGQCRAHTLCLCHVGRGKGGYRSGSGRTTHSWHDGLSHAPVLTKMDAYRVIRHPGDENEKAPWACEARRQRGPVEIASRACTRGPASVCLTCVWPWMGVPGERITEESYASLSWNQPPVNWKPKDGSVGGVMVRERGFLVLTSKPTYNVFKRFRLFCSSPKKKKKNVY